MPHLITVDISQQYVLSGHRSDCDRCPIALAIFDHLEEPWDVEVYEKRVRFASLEKTTDDAIWVDLPEKASEFVRTFDRKGRTHVKPLSFPIDVSAVPAEAFRAEVSV